MEKEILTTIIEPTEKWRKEKREKDINDAT